MLFLVFLELLEVQSQLIYILLFVRTILILKPFKLNLIGRQLVEEILFQIVDHDLSKIFLHLRTHKLVGFFSIMLKRIYCGL